MPEMTGLAVLTDDVGQLRRQIFVPAYATDRPSLASVSQQLEALSNLLRDLSRAQDRSAQPYPPEPALLPSAPEGYSPMTDRDRQVETERRNMLQWSEGIGRRRGDFTILNTSADLPTLADAAAQLGDLADLTRALAEEIRDRAAVGQPARESDDVVIESWARAAGNLGNAVGHYGTACRQLGFLHRYSQHPDLPHLRKARHNAFLIAQRGIAETGDALAGARASLAGGAAQLEDEPPAVRTACRFSAEVQQTRPSVEAAERAAAPAPPSPRAPGTGRAR